MNPYLLDRPAIVAFSGGRSSGFMLRQIIDAFGGALPEEGGSSLRAAGYKEIGAAGGGSWSRSNRPRVDKHPLQEKIRWEVTA